MPTVNREEFLQRLEAVRPGLSNTDIIEQSSCVVFTGGQLVTFNREVCCRAPGPMPEDFTGAVRAAALTHALQKIPDDEVEVKAGKGELLVLGKRRHAGIHMEETVLLPVDKVEAPGAWRPLPQDFAEGVKLVAESASRNATKMVLTCVHVHPKWLESSDNFQATRYRTKTPVDGPILIRSGPITAAADMGATKISVTGAWAHFRAPGGRYLSCRYFKEQYPDVGKHLKFTGEPLELSQGLQGAVELAGGFAEDSEDKLITVELRPNKMRIIGLGDYGWGKEFRKVSYSGPEISFNIGPKLLAAIVSKHSECEVTPDRLKVEGGNWIYFSTLGVLGEEPKNGEVGDAKGKKKAKAN